MKPIINLSFLFFIVLLQLVSCSKDDPMPQNSSNTQNTWKLDSYAYSRSRSVQTSVTWTGGQPYTIVNIDSEAALNNNLFVVCNFVITFNTSATGTYIVKSINTVASDVTAKTMSIQCNVTNGSGSGAIYESVDSNTTATVKQVDSKFVVSITTPVTLTRTLNDGLAQAPQNILLSCNEVR